MATIGNGGAGFDYLYPCIFECSYDVLETWLRGMSFRIVPTSEVSEEFSEMLFGVYDVCVEFTSSDRDYSEQYLLWDIKNFKD